MAESLYIIYPYRSSEFRQFESHGALFNNTRLFLLETLYLADVLFELGLLIMLVHLAVALLPLFLQNVVVRTVEGASGETLCQEERVVQQLVGEGPLLRVEGQQLFYQLERTGRDVFQEVFDGAAVLLGQVDVQFLGQQGEIRPFDGRGGAQDATELYN